METALLIVEGLISLSSYFSFILEMSESDHSGNLCSTVLSVEEESQRVMSKI